MGDSTRRSTLLSLLALAVFCLVPGSAGAMKLGSPNIDQDLTDFGAGCDGGGSCVWMQKKLPGSEVKAPFKGTITKWRVVSTSTYTYQLVVLEKRKSGKYKIVGTSSPGVAPGAGEYEFPADMRIGKGEYIGIISPTLPGIFNPEAKMFFFSPAFDFPQSRKPSRTGADEYQYNATIKRR